MIRSLPLAVPGRDVMMRFTVIDPGTTVSYTGPGHLLKMQTAVVADGGSDLRGLLDGLDAMDGAAAQRIRRELAVFDEHCVPNDETATMAWLSEDGGRALAAIRVIDLQTRALSTKPEPVGLVIFNLVERRIVQVQNSYGALRREDRGRIRRDGRPVGRFYTYRLSPEWSIVP